MKNKIISILLLTVLLITLPSYSSVAPISIATNQWPPYIHAENQPLGTAADILKQIDFIKSFEIKKIYPKKIIIKIYEKKPIAILQYKKDKFYVSESINLINFIVLENYKNLPIVFGKKKNFKELYINLKKINFPLDLIKKYYFYESNRWDLEIYQKKIIKLPTKNYIQSLEKFINFKMENNLDKYKVFDYRINNQLILK